MKPILFSWKPRSEQGVLLAKQLGAEYVYRDNSNYVLPNKNRVVINWGCGGGWFPWRPSQWKRVFNKPEAINRCVDKITTFQLLKRKRFPTPEFTTNPSVAFKWIQAGGVVYGRGNTEGNNGKGIRIFHLKKNPEYVTIASINGIPLFTKGVVKHTTFRAFVFGGKVDRVYEVDHDDDYKGRPNPYIHNHKNGWTFYDARKDVPSKRTRERLGRAVKALGLDFGAVDFGLDQNNRKFVIYEVNSAFGGELEDAQLNARAFRRAYKEFKK